VIFGGIGNGEWGTGNREQGMGNREWGMEREKNFNFF
jgi:hypothetical protein